MDARNPNLETAQTPIHPEIAVNIIDQIKKK